MVAEENTATPLVAFLKADKLEINFGTVYMGQVCGPLPIQVKSSDLTQVTLSSSLYSIVYFEGGAQEIHDLSSYQVAGNNRGDATAECKVFFKPDKLGPQEKYI